MLMEIPYENQWPQSTLFISRAISISIDLGKYLDLGKVTNYYIEVQFESI
jgi:hypothetical protein